MNHITMKYAGGRRSLNSETVMLYGNMLVSLTDETNNTRYMAYGYRGKYVEFEMRNGDIEDMTIIHSGPKVELIRRLMYNPKNEVRQYAEALTDK